MLANVDRTKIAPYHGTRRDNDLSSNKFIKINELIKKSNKLSLCFL
jgi:hypothetical protein